MQCTYVQYMINKCNFNPILVEVIGIDVLVGLSITQVKRADMGLVMNDLGADWDRDELSDALKALDPSDSGSVDFPDFVRWWLN